MKTFWRFYVGEQCNLVTPRNLVTNQTCNNFASIGYPLFLIPTTDREVLRAFINLKNSMSKDDTDLQLKPTKHVIDIIAPVLFHIYVAFPCLQVNFRRGENS